MATAAKNKIVRAYTAKDIESDNLECALINQLKRISIKSMMVTYLTRLLSQLELN